MENIIEYIFFRIMTLLSVSSFCLLQMSQPKWNFNVHFVTKNIKRRLCLCLDWNLSKLLKNYLFFSQIDRTYFGPYIWHLNFHPFFWPTNIFTYVRFYHITWIYFTIRCLILVNLSNYPKLQCHFWMTPLLFFFISKRSNLRALEFSVNFESDLAWHITCGNGFWGK